MIRLLGVAMIGGAICGSAVAAQAQTILNLSATGQTEVAPDEMVAAMQVQASASQAAAAQGAVNAAMQKALELAQAVPGVVATTNGYNVFQTNADNGAAPPKFQASQNLRLVILASDGVPPGRFTALLSQLQENGLLLNTLEGDLSRVGHVRAGQAAVVDGIDQIEAQAAMVAARLKMRVGGIKTLSVNGSSPEPGPVPRVMMMSAMAPPQAAPDKVTVQANVSATMTLLSAQ